MKRLIVFVPAFFLVLFLLNSFVLKDKKVEKESIKGSKSSAIANIIYKSTDGGQTWHNISEGLPDKLQREGVWSNSSLLENENGLYLRKGNGIYHNESNSTTPLWSKEVFTGRQRNIIPIKNGILAYDIRGQFVKKIEGSNVWSPMYTNFQEQAVRLDKTIDWMYKTYKEKEVRTVFVTATGTVLIGSSNSLFRSTNGGTTWSQLHVGDGRMKIIEANGVLLSTSKNGILRSTDDGLTWDRLLTDGGLSTAVESIGGGFAALVYNTTIQTNSIHVSMDSGKTWKVIGEELQPSWSGLFMRKMGLLKTSDIISIKQMGKYLICGRADGIFRSADKGKTWEKLALPAVENLGFNLSVSGNTIYVMPGKGC